MGIHRRRLLTTILAFFLAVGTAAAKLPLPERILQSIVAINYTDDEGNPHYCTGISTSAGIVTARHCIGDELTVDDEASHVLKVNSHLALLQPTSKKPVLLIRTKPLQLGEHLLSFGYAYGNMEMLTRNVSRLWLAGMVSVDGPFGQGMSGGPTVDMNGKLVGINQATNGLTGIFSGPNELAEFVR